MSHAPIEPEFHAKMNALAGTLDRTFNGDAKGDARKIGFVLLVFSFGDETRANYISNADRKGIVTTLKELVARFEGQPEIRGTA